MGRAWACGRLACPLALHPRPILCLRIRQTLAVFFLFKRLQPPTPFGRLAISYWAWVHIQPTTYGLATSLGKGEFKGIKGRLATPTLYGTGLEAEEKDLLPFHPTPLPFRVGCKARDWRQEQSRLQPFPWTNARGKGLADLSFLLYLKNRTKLGNIYQRVSSCI
jgi:hypothetical protein